MKDLVTSYVIIFIFVYLIVTFIVQPFTVSGASMQPTLHEGDLIIVSKLHHLYISDLKAGDIIAFLDPADRSRILIKRIQDVSDDQRRSYFVIGDNVRMSIDSRAFGPVIEEKIIGKAILVAWPPEEIRSLLIP